ncbi:MAG TPA: YfiR family protein [Kofleriaceae bacterium]|jgi:hypothetical protein|nr:YfiR family protein [Kofleriaceae bacterium]
MLAFGLTAPTAAADASDDRRALVMLRVLAYDKHLGDRIGDDSVAIVVAFPPTEAGNAERSRWTAAFDSVSQLKVAGRSVTVVAHRFEDARKLDRELQGAHAAALVVCDGLTRSIPVGELAAVTRARKVLSFSTREPEVVKGLAIGVVTGAKRDEIVVNLTAVTAEGVKFDAGLLQLARTVEDRP